MLCLNKLNMQTLIRPVKHTTLKLTSYYYCYSFILFYFVSIWRTLTLFQPQLMFWGHCYNLIAFVNIKVLSFHSSPHSAPV